MPRHWSARGDDTWVDWGAVWDKEAGIFAYGFEAENVDVPYAFYMKGVPGIAAWMWQRFQNLRRVEPDLTVWQLPEACETARPCPGWEPGAYGDAKSPSARFLAASALVKTGVDRGSLITFT